MPEYTIERKNDIPLILEGELIYGTTTIYRNQISTYDAGTWLFQTNAGNYLLVEGRRDGTTHHPLYIHRVIPHPDRLTTYELIECLGSPHRAKPILKLLGKVETERFE